MAREVFIYNSRLFKKSLSLADIIGDSTYKLSYLDEHMRMTDQKSESRFTFIYDGNCIGRGVQVVENNKNTIHLALPLPCTKEDIQMLYKVSRRIASLWKSDSITVEDTKVALSEIEHMEEYDISMNKSFLGNASKVYVADVTLFCATLPICVTVTQLQNYSENYQAFSQYLNEKQQIGAFYSCPIFCSLKGEIVSMYVGISDGEFILPYTPQMSFNNDDKEVQCDRALVAIPDLFPGKLSQLDFQTFIDRIPKEKKTEFDCQHILVTGLTNKDLLSIFGK